MTSHSSASMREETSHANRTTRTNTILNALKQRAQDVLNDETIDPQSRGILRKALQVNDPWLADLVRRAEADETIADLTDFSQTRETYDTGSSNEKIEALAEIICHAGDECAAALLVLMGQRSVAPLPMFKASLAAPIRKAPGRTEFQRGILATSPDGTPVVRTTGDQGSGILSSMSQANCFIVLPAGMGNVAAGEVVDVQPLEGLV